MRSVSSYPQVPVQILHLDALAAPSGALSRVRVLLGILHCCDAGHLDDRDRYTPHVRGACADESDDTTPSLIT